MNKVFLIIFLVFLNACTHQGQEQKRSEVSSFDRIFTAKAELPFNERDYITDQKEKNFPLIIPGRKISLLVDTNDHAGVQKVVELFQKDLIHVSGNDVEVVHSVSDVNGIPVIIGALDESPLIQALAENGKTDISNLQGVWEKYHVQVVDSPLEGLENALVISGSDKRGTIYGMFDLSRQLGVSPWYWWADVPVKQRKYVYVKPGVHTVGSPKVQYRGIFINDEAPALSGWVHEKFGGFNHQFYEHVFELILRLKGNYLWPAMWGRSVYDDDPESPVLADMYGVVLGTSHHEPLSRAHVEWSRYGEGAWNYEKNKANLQAFWRKGIRRMEDNESIVTIGMRGDGDEPMTEGTAIALLEEIVKDQREIIAEETGKPTAQTPQMWALYKEVQAYYDNGMRVPDDVTLLLCDDNWGNIRKLPKLDDTTRTGGYGIYYHFDYVGGPRNYKWLNTTQISRVWEQMHMAYEYGAKKLWVVNVGDIKPMEFPISFFLDYAWNPESIPAAEIPTYGEQWAAAQFGEKHSKVIADLIAEYTRFNSRRKPELLSPETYSLAHYREFERIVNAYKALEQAAQKINDELPEAYRSAYYQLVLYPISACANLNELYFTVAKNRLYAKQGRAQTNGLADQAQALYERDQKLADQYHQLSDGKWNHQMAQTHIGYTIWQEPKENIMPEVEIIDLPQMAQMAIAVENTDEWWPDAEGLAELPTFESWANQHFYIELFNQGKMPFDFDIESDAPVILSAKNGAVTDQQRIEVSVDFDQVSQGKHEYSLLLKGVGEEIPVKIRVDKRDVPTGLRPTVNGSLAIEAAGFSRKQENEKVHWLEIPQLGRTSSAMTIVPVTTPAQPADEDGVALEYDIFLPAASEATVELVFSPTLNFHNTEGLKCALAIDDQEPQIINLHENFDHQAWQEAVRTNTIVSSSLWKLNEGKHMLKYYAVDPGVVLQRIVVYQGEKRESYLGPG